MVVTSRRRLLAALGGMVGGSFLSGFAFGRPAARQKSPLFPPKPSDEDPPGHQATMAKVRPTSGLVVQESETTIVHRLLAPLAVGSRIGRTSLSEVHGVRLGAAAVGLRDRSGHLLQVDICSHDGGSVVIEAMASTKKYDLFLANSGDGRRPTGQDACLAVRALARIIERNEETLPRLSVITLAERLRQFPRGRFTILTPTSSLG